MTDIKREPQPTRGEKVWALDIAQQLLWHELWDPKRKQGWQPAELDEEELRRCLAIIERLIQDLERQRGQLHRSYRGSAQ